MNQIQRYIFRRLLGSFAIAFPALALVIWLTQALGRLGLITDRGQSLMSFLEVTILFLPGLITIIGPVSVLIATMAAVNGLSGDSELISLNAGGGSPRLLLKPVLALAIPAAFLSAASTLYFAPLTVHASNVMIARINSDVLGALIQPGQFRSLDAGVTVQIRDRLADGTLLDLFVFDRRDPAETATYVGKTGRLIGDDSGRFLLMQDGLIQRQQVRTGEIVTITFDSYALDLTAIASVAQGAAMRPNERSTAYILDPDPSDPVFQANPFRYTAELHTRLSLPFYAIALGLIPAAILGPVRSVRQRRGVANTMAAVLGSVTIAAGLFVTGALAGNPAMLVVVWGLPALGILLPVYTLATGRRISFPWLRALRHRLRPPRSRAAA